MPTPIAVIGDVFKIRYACRFGSQYALNIGHSVCTAVTGVAPNLQELATGVRLLAGAFYPALLANDAEFYGVAVQRIYPTLSLEYTDASAPLLGTAGAAPLPSQICGLISYYCDAAGRKFRGRAYYPFPAQADNTLLDGPQASYITRLGSLGNWYLSDNTYTSGTGGTAILRQGLYDKVSHAFTRFAYQFPRAFWATQRRRASNGFGDDAPFF
jgi:hypothetical protein